MRITRTLVAGLAAAGVVASGLAAPASAATPAATDRPDWVKIHLKDFTGSGCSAADTGVVTNDDHTSIDMVFNRFVAKAQGRNKRATTGCQAMFSLEYPEGWTYAVVDTVFAGRNYLTKGAESQLNARHYFAGDSGSSMANQVWKGAIEDKAFTFSRRHDRQVTAPCGRTTFMIADTKITAKSIGANDEAEISLDAKSVGVATKMNINWSRC